VVEHIEKEGGLGTFAVLAAPQVFLVGGRRPKPALAILFIQRDLAERSVDQPGQVLRHEAERLVEVD